MLNTIQIFRFFKQSRFNPRCNASFIRKQPIGVTQCPLNKDTKHFKHSITQIRFYSPLSEENRERSRDIKFGKSVITPPLIISSSFALSLLLIVLTLCYIAICERNNPSPDGNKMPEMLEGIIRAILKVISGMLSIINRDKDKSPNDDVENSLTVLVGDLFEDIEGDIERLEEIIKRKDFSMLESLVSKMNSSISKLKDNIIKNIIEHNINTIRNLRIKKENKIK